MAQRSTNRAKNRGTKDGKFLCGQALTHVPGIACVKNFVEIAGAALGDYVLYLLVHDVFVPRQIVPGAKHADGCGEAGAMFHVRKQKCVRGTGMMRVVNDEIRFGDAVAERHHLDIAVRLAANALVAVLSEHERFAMLELNDMLSARIAVGE